MFGNIVKFVIKSTWTTEPDCSWKKGTYTKQFEFLLLHHSSGLLLMSLISSIFNCQNTSSSCLLRNSSNPFVTWTFPLCFDTSSTNLIHWKNARDFLILQIFNKILSLGAIISIFELWKVQYYWQKLKTIPGLPQKKNIPGTGT